MKKAQAIRFGDWWRGGALLLGVALVFPAGARAGVVEYPTPTQPSNPTGIVQGLDGAMWFTEPTANRIGRITPAGQIVEFSIPTSSSDPEQLAVGSDGAIWFTERRANQIGRIPTSATVADPQITEFPLPGAAGPVGIAGGSDGALWFTEQDANKIGRIPVSATPANPQITEFSIPTAAAAPSGITSGPDQALWFTEEGAGQLGRIPVGATPANPQITEFSIPTAGSDPVAIVTGPDGALWFAERGGGKLGRMPAVARPGSVPINEYPTPSAGPQALTTAAIATTGTGPVPGLWLSEAGDEQHPAEVTAFDPATHSFAPYQLQSRDVPAGIVGGPDGAVWFADRGSSQIGRVPEPAVGGSFAQTEGLASSTAIATVYGTPLSASINWGDGATSTGTISQGPTGNSATATVSGLHAYAEEGSQTAIVTAYYCTPPSQACARSVTAQATIPDAPLSATGADDPQPTIRTKFTATLATFTDADPQGGASDYTATIDWGDGTNSAADSISPDAGGFDVVGSHTYSRYGIKTVTVTIADGGGAGTTTQLDITPQFPRPPNCDPHECPGPPPPQGTPCPPGYYGLEPNCSPPTPSNCFAPDPVAGQNWVEGNPDIDSANGNILSQALEFGNLVLVATGDCWHYDGNSGGEQPDFGAGGLQLATDAPRVACRPPSCHPAVYGFFHTAGGVLVNGVAIQNECATIRVSTSGEISADPYKQGCRTLLDRYSGTMLDRATGHLPVGECAGVECADRGQFQGFLADANLSANPWVVDGDHLASLTANLPEAQDNGVGGFPLVGTLELTVPGKGLLHIDANAQLPHAFSTDRDGAGPPPSAPIGLDEGFAETGSGPFAGDRERARGVAARAAAADPPSHLHFDDVWLGGLDIHDVNLDYDETTRVWSAGGNLYLVGLELGGGEFRWGPNGFIGGSAFHDFNPPLPVATDVGVAHIDFDIEVGPPTKVKGHVTIEAGGGIASLDGGAFAVFATGTHPYSYQPNDIPGVGQLAIPHGSFSDTVIGAGGTVQVTVPVVNFSFPLASAYVVFSPGFFEFAGGVHLPFGPLTIDGGVAGAIGHVIGGGTGFDLEGFVHACLGWSALSICGDIDGIVSSVGAQVCFGDQGGEIYWSTGIPQPIFWDCDITGFRPAFGAADAAADGTGAGRSLTLPHGLPAAEIELIGNGGPPDVTLTGPSGRQVLISYGPKHPAGRDAVLGAQLPAQQQTYLGIRLPDAGRWTITPKPGSPAITGLLVADGLPPARILASVYGSGYRRMLRYRIRPRPGEQVEFVERGRQTYQVLGVAHEGAGRLMFTPGLGPSGPRRIVAIIELGGMPVKNLVVASYDAPGSPRPPRPPHLRATLGAGVLRVSWGASAHSSRYEVTIRSSDGRNLSFARSASQRSLTLAGYGGTGATVTVAGFGPAGDEGEVARARIAPPAPPAPVTGLVAALRPGTMELRWRRVARAARYQLTLTLASGRHPRQLSFDVSATTVTVQGLRPGEHVIVSIRAVSPGFVRGAATNKRVLAR